MKFDYIDSMRGIAILMVIFVHTSQSVPNLHPHSPLGLFSDYTQTGVQLFFLASAYTLCISYEKRRDEKHKILNYVTRRFFRIAPAYYIIGILGYFLLELIRGYTQQGSLIIPEKYSIVNVLTNIFFIHGFHPPSNNTIVPGGWSIGTEVAFYALFPFIAVISFYCHEKWKQKILFLPVFTLAVSLILQILIYRMTNQVVDKNNFIYFNIVNQLPVFALGVAKYFSDKKRSKDKIPIIIMLIGFIFFTLLSLLTWHSQSLFKFAFVPALSGLSFIFLMDLFKALPVLNFPLLRRIGTLSFSMYLVHFVFSWEVARKINGALDFEPKLALTITYLVSVTGSFICALIAERLIEKPFIEYGRRLIQERER